MKAILMTVVLLMSATSFAASVCIYTVPSAYGDDVTLYCDGKLTSHFAMHVDTEMGVKTTLVLKKLLDSGYRIVSESGSDYTLVK